MAFPLKAQIKTGQSMDPADDTMPRGKRGPPAGFPPKHQPPGAATAKHRKGKQKPSKQFGLV